MRELHSRRTDPPKYAANGVKRISWSCMFGFDVHYCLSSDDDESGDEGGGNEGLLGKDSVTNTTATVTKTKLKSPPTITVAAATGKRKSPVVTTTAAVRRVNACLSASPSRKKQLSTIKSNKSNISKNGGTGLDPIVLDFSDSDDQEEAKVGDKRKLGAPNSEFKGKQQLPTPTPALLGVDLPRTVTNPVVVPNPLAGLQQQTLDDVVAVAQKRARKIHYQATHSKAPPGSSYGARPSASNSDNNHDTVGENSKLFAATNSIPKQLPRKTARPIQSNAYFTQQQAYSDDQAQMMSNHIASLDTSHIYSQDMTSITNVAAVAQKQAYYHNQAQMTRSNLIGLSAPTFVNGGGMQRAPGGHQNGIVPVHDSPTAPAAPAVANGALSTTGGDHLSFDGVVFDSPSKTRLPPQGIRNMSWIRTSKESFANPNDVLQALHKYKPGGHLQISSQQQQHSKGNSISVVECVWHSNDPEDNMPVYYRGVLENGRYWLEEACFTEPTSI